MNFRKSWWRPAGDGLRRLLPLVKVPNPDAIFFGGYDREAGLMIKQMRQLGIPAKFFTGDGACTPDLLSYWSGGAAPDDQVVCATPAGVPGAGSPAVARFVLEAKRGAGRLSADATLAARAIAR